MTDGEKPGWRAARDVRTILRKAREGRGMIRQLCGMGALADPVRRADKAKEIDHILADIEIHALDALYPERGIPAPVTD